MNFQSESKKSGDEFEDSVLIDLKSRGFYQIQKNVFFKDIGCEVDFIAKKPGFSSTNPRRPTYTEKEYVEAKGGKDGAGKRPGAQRTDNVKKAIANGALIKSRYPDTYFVVYFSARPIINSASAKMIEVALENKIIDEVRYIGSIQITDQLDLFSMS